MSCNSYPYIMTDCRQYGMNWKIVFPFRLLSVFKIMMVSYHVYTDYYLNEII